MVEETVWHGRRRKEEERRKPWPLPPPQFPLETETPEILAFGKTPQTELDPRWIQPAPTPTRGLVYRPPLPVPETPPVSRRRRRIAVESVSMPIATVDEPMLRRRQRNRQEEDLILALLMQGVL